MLNRRKPESVFHQSVKSVDSTLSLLHPHPHDGSYGLVNLSLSAPTIWRSERYPKGKSSGRAVWINDRRKHYFLVTKR